MTAQLDFHVASTHWFWVLNQIIWIPNPHMGFEVEVQILPTKSSIQAHPFNVQVKILAPKPYIDVESSLVVRQSEPAPTLVPSMLGAYRCSLRSVSSWMKWIFIFFQNINSFFMNLNFEFFFSWFTMILSNQFQQTVSNTYLNSDTCIGACR